MNELKFRVEFILPVNERNRVTYQKNTNGQTEIVLDLHGLSCREARHMIINLLNILRQKVHIILIHGYNHGTAIKEMLPTIRNEHIASIQPDSYNAGRTHLLTA